MTAAVPQAAVDAAQQVLRAHSVALALGAHACAECGFPYEDLESWSRHRAEAVAAAVVAAVQGPIKAEALREFAGLVRTSRIPRDDYIASLAYDRADRLEAQP